MYFIQGYCESSCPVAVIEYASGPHPYVPHLEV